MFWNMSLMVFIIQQVVRQGMNFEKKKSALNFGRDVIYSMVCKSQLYENVVNTNPMVSILYNINYILLDYLLLKAWIA